ncbi:MAG: glycine cleavage complex lipoylprotein [Candidatus Thorarchaeota archaeon]|nr:MAG: glycine cleavage complex lipoylprotein [Candidatus Thorarchaeota archaeon]
MTESKVIDGLRYSKEHEWAKEEDGLIVVGISDYAQESIHEITFIEVSEAGTEVEAGGECGLIESMKASSSIYSPVAGEIVEVNEELEVAPEIVNEDPYGKGWLFKIKPTNKDADLDALMDSSAYSEYIESL